MVLEIKIKSKVVIEKATEGSSGYDLQAQINGLEGVTIRPFSIEKFSTGIFLEIPKGYEGQIRSRSGLASRGISIAQGIGTVDADYRGELIVCLHNNSNQDFVIHDKNKIAQLIFAKIEQVNFIALEEDEVLSETARGEGGFGSTGE